jgi:hypothetical protein
MSTTAEKILQDEVKGLNEQLYASYTRVMELLDKIKDLDETIADQSDIIDELVEKSASGRDRKSNG